LEQKLIIYYPVRKSLTFYANERIFKFQLCAVSQKFPILYVGFIEGVKLTPPLTYLHSAGV